MALVHLKVEAVALDWKGHPLVVLRELDGKRAVFIWIGIAEATAISMVLEGQDPPRPFTHDLLMSILRDAGGKVEQVVITNVQVDTYYADLTLTYGERSVTFDCRPSDAIALALRDNAPLSIREDLLQRLERERQEREESDEPELTIIDTGETTVH